MKVEIKRLLEESPADPGRHFDQELELGELGALRPRGREASAIEVGEGHGIATSMSMSEFP
jgi:hypothetical protein